MWGSGVPVLVGGHLCGCSCVGCVLGEGCLPLPPFLSVGERGDVDVMQYFWTQMYSAALHLPLRICPIKNQGAGFVCSLFAVLTQTEKNPIFHSQPPAFPSRAIVGLCHFPSKVVFLSTRLSVQCQCTPKRLWPRLGLESFDGEIELEFNRILFLSRFIWGKIYVGDHSFMAGETANAVPWLSWQQCLSFTSAVDGGSTSAVGLLATWKVRAEKVLKSEFVSKKWHVAHVFTLTAASFKTGSLVNEICAQLSLYHLHTAYSTHQILMDYICIGDVSIILMADVSIGDVSISNKQPDTKCI